jgi:hypothetical protein
MSATLCEPERIVLSAPGAQGQRPAGRLRWLERRLGCKLARQGTLLDRMAERCSSRIAKVRYAGARCRRGAVERLVVGRKQADIAGSSDSTAWILWREARTTIAAPARLIARSAWRSMIAAAACTSVAENMSVCSAPRCNSPSRLMPCREAHARLEEVGKLRQHERPTARYVLRPRRLATSAGHPPGGRGPARAPGTVANRRHHEFRRLIMSQHAAARSVCADAVRLERRV